MIGLHATASSLILDQLLRFGHSCAPRALLASLSLGSSLVRCQPIHDANGGCIMRQSLFLVLVLVVTCSRVEAACLDPSTVAHSTVSIARDFNDEESKAQTGIIGISGTAWFLSSRLLVIAAHVAEAMQLSAQEWKELEVRDGESKRSVAVRVRHLAGPQVEKIAVLELRSAIPDAVVLQRRAGPLVPEEGVVSLAYP